MVRYGNQMVLVLSLGNISTTETDPQVGTNTTDYLSKWDGSKLVKSSILEYSNNRLKIESDDGYIL